MPGRRRLRSPRTYQQDVPKQLLEAEPGIDTLAHLRIHELAEESRRSSAVLVQVTTAERLVAGESTSREEVADAPEIDQTVERSRRGPRATALAIQLLDAVAGTGEPDARTGILNAEIGNVGRRVWNRLRYIKNPATGKRVSRLNPSDQWVVADVPGLRIIDDDVSAASRRVRRSCRRRSAMVRRAGNPVKGEGPTT